MDINGSLTTTLEMARRVLATSTEESSIRLADEVMRMHQWLTQGGSYPLVWVEHPRENMGRGESRSGL